MNNSLEKYLNNYLGTISDSSLEQFKSIFTEKKVLKDKILLQQGKVSSNFYIIKTGLVASFIKHEDGHDFIRTLYKPLNELSSLASLIKKEKSNANYRCLTECIVIQGCFNDFLELIEKNPTFSILYTKVLEKLHLTTEKRIEELTSLDSTERYIQLKKDIYGIDNLLPQYQIAKYLNITPVQLSRIRKKLLVPSLNY